MRAADGPTPFGDLNALLAVLVDGAREALGPRFLAAYIVGSFALGAGDPHSDVDFLVVTDGDPTSADRERLQELHARLHGRAEPWATHLEGSYIPASLLRRVDARRTPLVYLDNGASELVLDPHCNTAVTRWTLREHGIVLHGPPPETLVEPVGLASLRSEALETLPALAAWARELEQARGAGRPAAFNRWAQPYIVLSLCRMLRTLECGDVVSKQRAGEWASALFADPAQRELIRRALDDRPDPWTRYRQAASADAVAATLAFVTAAERRAALSASGRTADR